MGIVKAGDMVSVEYVGTLDDGSVFDKSDGTPLTFKAGSGQVIKGFDEAVIGMKLNETKKVSIPPEEGYGKRDPALRIEISREQLPPDFDGKAGDMVGMQSPTGQRMVAEIVSVNEKGVVLDLNHPMAGKTLNFEITLVEIGSEGCSGNCGHEHCESC